MKNEHYTSFGNPIYETDNYVYFSISEGQNAQFIISHQYIYAKQSRKTYTLKTGEFARDTIFNIAPAPIGIHGNYYVGLFNDSMLENYKDIFQKLEESNRKIIIQNPALAKIFGNLDKDVNMESVIVLYEIENIDE
jgi:hypothetical protein